MTSAIHSYSNPSLFINGRWVPHDPLSPGIEVINPANEELLAKVPIASSEQIDEALAGAKAAFPVWRDTAPDKRASVLNKAAALLRERHEVIATLMTMEQGKTLAEARTEVVRSAAILEWDAAEAMRFYGHVIPSARGMRNSVLMQPIGPVAAFTPWNAPIGSLGRKVAAALASGCSLIVKAPEETPASVCAFVKCFEDAGLPAGTLNLLFGRPAEISERLITSPVIRLVTFTGSVTVGKHLAQLAAAHMKPAIMELGGHAPVIVCADADPVKVAQQGATAKFRMAGQICVSPTRFIVHESIRESFVDAFAQTARVLQVGDGTQPNVQMGPVANRRRLNAMEELVDNAVSCGAHLVTGGKRIGDKGFFFEPTVLARVPAEAKILSTEPFGPIAPIVGFEHLSEAIEIANGLPLGLSAYAFTNAADSAGRLSDEIECGILSINHYGGPAPEMPFGGVKDSGMGREGGSESLTSYMVRKTVSHRLYLA